MSVPKLKLNDKWKNPKYLPSDEEDRDPQQELNIGHISTILGWSSRISQVQWDICQEIVDNGGAGGPNWLDLVYYQHEEALGNVEIEWT